MIAVVFVAGALGATLRYLIDGIVQERWGQSFPLGTFAVNMSGALLLGLLTGFLLGHTSAPLVLRYGAGVGFVGAYTTFSTLMFQSFRLLREGAWQMALVNTLGSTVGGMAAAFDFSGLSIERYYHFHCISDHAFLKVLDELGLAGASDEALIDAMLAHPMLINRPLVVIGDTVRLCRPSETVLALLPAVSRD